MSPSFAPSSPRFPSERARARPSRRPPPRLTTCVVMILTAGPLAFAQSVDASAGADPFGGSALALAAERVDAPPTLPPGPWTVSTEGRFGWDALVAAVDRAPAVRVAASAFEVAARNAAATGAPNLRLSLGAQAVDGSRTPLDGADAEDLGDTSWTSVSIEARLPLPAFGPNADAAEAAQAAVDAAETAWRAARRAVHLAAVQAALEALRAEAQVGVAIEERAWAERQRDATLERRSRGDASDLDVAQADLAVARAEQGVAVAQRAWSSALRSLDEVLGRSGLVPSPAVPPIDVGALASAFQRVGGDVALDGRSDVAASVRALDEAVRRRDAAIRDALPVARVDVDWTGGDDQRAFGASASVDTQSVTPVARFTFDPDDGLPGLGAGGSSSTWTVRVALDVAWSPALTDALAGVREEVQRAETDLATTIDGATVASRRAASDVLDALDAAALATTSADLARATADVTRLRFEAGTASPASVERADLDAVLALLDAVRAHDALHLAVLRAFDILGVDPPALELP